MPAPPCKDPDGDDHDSPPANESRWTLAGLPYRMRAWSAAQWAALTPLDRSMLRCARRHGIARRQGDGSYHLIIAG
jgi:hypothetical protein